MSVMNAAIFADQVPSRLMRLNETKEATGQSTSGLYRAVADGTFLKPVKLGNTSCWPASEIQAWLKEVIGGATPDQLRQLVTKIHAARKQGAA